MVDFSDTPQEAAWRTEVRQFIDGQLPDELRDDARYAGTLGGLHRGPLSAERRRELVQRWRRSVLERGWIAPHWPKEYGGAGMTPMQQFVMREVFADARAPLVSVHDVGSTILVHGSEEQKRRYLPPLVEGKETWCQGYSEPGAGSDLASLQTRAVRDGDDFVINGQKIWTSGAMTADMMFALVRTDPDAPKHRGITYLLLSMKSPGITVRPLAQMTGAQSFTEVFFEDVRAPVRNAVGEVNRGWYVGATHLDFERSSIGSAVGLQQRVERLLTLLSAERDAARGRTTLGRSTAVRAALADRYLETAVARNFSNRIITLQNRGIIPNYESSVQKLFTSELHQRIANTALKGLGLYGQLYDDADPRSPDRAWWPTYYLASVSETVGAGTSEIQRNVIATRGLGLPRG
jgi:alkylation response protein AidB-like acyl-CoA dehydrogenase